MEAQKTESKLNDETKPPAQTYPAINAAIYSQRSDRDLLDDYLQDARWRE